MTTFKDTDLREALRRKYADTPPTPTDLGERLMKRMETTGGKPKHRHWPYITTAIAAAAAILLLVVLHLGQGQTGQRPMMAEKPTTPMDSVRQMRHISPATEKREIPVVAQTTPTKPQTIHEKTTGMERPKADTTSTVESLADCIARLEAEMENIDDSVRSAHIEKLIAADARLQQMVFRIIGKETQQTLNEIENEKKETPALAQVAKENVKVKSKRRKKRNTIVGVQNTTSERDTLAMMANNEVDRAVQEHKTVNTPDPFLTFEDRTRDIRLRGERLHHEVAMLMNNQ